MDENKNETYILYGIGIVAILMLGWVFYGFISPPQPAQYQTSGASSGAQATFSQQSNNIDDECGDLNDASNVQHLGHHPDQFASCLKKANPNFLKQATGKTLDELIGSGDPMASMH